jgi:glycosyltransferase involved in cell wall biosynthesis
MFISVVMANYNGQKYLANSIMSVLNQQYDNFEFIIVDDGSTDNSVKIIKKYLEKSKKTIIPIFSHTNRGQGVSFNKGIEIAQGDLIALIDSDDLWFPQKLSNVSKFFSLKYEDVALFQHNLLIMDDNKITEKRFRDILYSGDLLEYTKKNNCVIPGPFIPTTGLTIPIKILKRILPIPSEFRTCADGYLTRTSICFGDVFSVNECWGAYRLHSENYTLKNPEFDEKKYIHGILIPAIDKFYRENKINFQASDNIIHKNALLKIGNFNNNICSPTTKSKINKFINFKDYIVPSGFTLLLKFIIPPILYNKKKNSFIFSLLPPFVPILISLLFPPKIINVVNEMIRKIKS